MNKLWKLMRAALAATLIALASGCAAVSSKGNETMMVSVKGVNYSGDVVVFSVDDPAAPKNATGGDRAGPYTGAGIQCCIKLPKVWHPGINLVIDAIIYPVDESDFTRDLPRYMKKFPVEVAQYAANQPTELWVIRTAQGDMNLVASNVDPTHEAWPGAVKGWPEPSLAYRRKHWNLRVQSARSAVDAFRSAFENGVLKPKAISGEWEQRRINRPNEIKDFSGPDDPKFREAVTKRFADVLRHYETELQQLLENEP
jgi:hypothetical protein